jgi:plasmid maintenance system antidote protein VapI
MVNNRRSITIDTALRLSLYFADSRKVLDLQAHYDLKIARRSLKAGGRQAHLPLQPDIWASKRDRPASRRRLEPSFLATLIGATT